MLGPLGFIAEVSDSLLDATGLPEKSPPTVQST